MRNVPHCSDQTRGVVLVLVQRLYMLQPGRDSSTVVVVQVVVEGGGGGTQAGRGGSAGLVRGRCIALKCLR